MLAFAVLNQSHLVLQPKNHHIISITLGGENYDDLGKALKAFFEDLDELDSNGIWVNLSSKKVIFSPPPEAEQYLWSHHDIDLLFSSVEGKNHVHVHKFFSSTHRDGGWPGENPEVELMQIERRIFYCTHALRLEGGENVHHLHFSNVSEEKE